MVSSEEGFFFQTGTSESVKIEMGARLRHSSEPPPSRLRNDTQAVRIGLHTASDPEVVCNSEPTAHEDNPGFRLERSGRLKSRLPEPTKPEKAGHVGNDNPKVQIKQEQHHNEDVDVSKIIDHGSAEVAIKHEFGETPRDLIHTSTSTALIVIKQEAEEELGLLHDVRSAKGIVKLEKDFDGQHQERADVINTELEIQIKQEVNEGSDGIRSAAIAAAVSSLNLGYHEEPEEIATVYAEATDQIKQETLEESMPLISIHTTVPLDFEDSMKKEYSDANVRYGKSVAPIKSESEPFKFNYDLVPNNLFSRLPDSENKLYRNHIKPPKTYIPHIPKDDPREVAPPSIPGRLFSDLNLLNIGCLGQKAAKSSPGPCRSAIGLPARELGKEAYPRIIASFYAHRPFDFVRDDFTVVARAKLCFRHHQNQDQIARLLLDWQKVWVQLQPEIQSQDEDAIEVALKQASEAIVPPNSGCQKIPLRKDTFDFQGEGRINRGSAAFRPYHDKPHRLTLQDALSALARSRLSARAIGAGYLYVHKHLGTDFTHVKIGYTAEHVGVEERLKQWRKACGKMYQTVTSPESEITGGHRLVPHAFRVEQLVHMELRDKKRLQLAWSARGHASMDLEPFGGCYCGRAHREWFEVSNAHAHAVIKKWSDWISQNPYELETAEIMPSSQDTLLPQKTGTGKSPKVEKPKVVIVRCQLKSAFEDVSEICKIVKLPERTQVPARYTRPDVHHHRSSGTPQGRTRNRGRSAAFQSRSSEQIDDILHSESPSPSPRLRTETKPQSTTDQSTSRVSSKPGMS